MTDIIKAKIHKLSSARADWDAIEVLEERIQSINSAHDSDTLYAQRKLIHAMRYLITRRERFLAARIGSPE